MTMMNVFSHETVNLKSIFSKDISFTLSLLRSYAAATLALFDSVLTCVFWDMISNGKLYRCTLDTLRSESLRGGLGYIRPHSFGSVYASVSLATFKERLLKRSVCSSKREVIYNSLKDDEKSFLFHSAALFRRL